MGAYFHPADISQIVSILKDAQIPVWHLDKNKHRRAYKVGELCIVADAAPETVASKLKEVGLTAYVDPDISTVTTGDTRKGSICKIDILSSWNQKRFGRAVQRWLKKNVAHYMLEGLRQMGLLQNLFPELYDCIATPGGPHHEETIFEHLMGAIKHAKCPQYPTHVQVGILLHDIGKPATMKLRPDEYGVPTTTFWKHETVGASIAYNILQRWKLPHHAVEYITKLVRWHMFRFYPESKESSIRKWMMRVGRRQIIADLMKVRQADRKGHSSNKHKPAMTPQMKELIERVNNLEVQFEIAYPGDLNLCAADREWVERREDSTSIYLGLANLVNQGTGKNDAEKMKEHIQKVYK